MRAILLLFPAVLMAQTPAPKPTAQAATTPKPATAAAPKPAGAATPKPAGTATPKPAAAATPKPAAPALTTDDDKIVYSLGLSISRSLAQFDLSPAEMEIVKQALTDAAANKPAIDIDTWGPKIQTLAGARASRVAGREKTASAAYLTKAAAEPGAVKTGSGLVYKELTKGSGASPKATDNVKVNYRGTLTNGTEFDSSYKRNMPAEFPLNGVIPCWTEGVQKMQVGGKSQLVCPSDIAYGDQGRPPQIAGGATLVFEVELLEVAGSGAEPPK
jgi:FKBP-type peptidyl-prolyl cis-trans isomerase FkpA